MVNRACDVCGVLIGLEGFSKVYFCNATLGVNNLCYPF